MGTGSKPRYFWYRRLRAVAGGEPDSGGWRGRHPRIAGTAITMVVVTAVGGSAMAFAHRPPRTPASHPATAAAAATTPAAPSAAVPPTEPAAATTAAAVPSPQQKDVRMVAAAPSGTLFAVRDTCVGCEAGAADPYDLLRSTNLGATWARISSLPGQVVGTGYPGPLLATGADGALWVVGDRSLFGSTDGGRTWRTWSMPGNAAPDGTRGREQVATAGNTLWLLWGDRVLVARPGTAPVVTSLRIPDVADIDAIAAATADRAVVLATATATAPPSVGVVYGTSDGGLDWTRMANPCTATGPLYWSTASFAPDGSLWVVCAGEPSGGGQPMKTLVISTDGGRSWTGHGVLEASGYGTDVVPVSVTVAWRSGGRADLYRTTDATHWTRVAVTGDAGGGAGATSLTALDADTALYIGWNPTGDQQALYLTRDGGRTWTTRRFPS